MLLCLLRECQLLVKDAKQTLASQVAPLKIPLASAGDVGSIPGLGAHLPDTRQLSRATPARSSA